MPAGPPAVDTSRVVAGVLTWYDEHARDLPWRRPEATPWQIMVSEFMLQQTPVSRVLAPWQHWVERWPSPAALAAAPGGEAVRAWGRLGYPRRALRLHQAAIVITERYGGEVPANYKTLRQLPGVGAYTAAAIATFAYGRRHAVLDTNVRRVLARVGLGEAYPAPATNAAEAALAETFLPRSRARAARWSVAAMELGALVCTARGPRCEWCPVAAECRWRAAGRPASTGRPPRRQAYAGTDRQCRGALLAVLRSSNQPVEPAALVVVWADSGQRERALSSLLADGLADRVGSRLALPGWGSDRTGSGRSGR